MLWILITVLVGLVVVIVQLLLAYQKRASRLRVAQNPVRKQIGDYKQKIDEVAEGVRTMANESLVKLKLDLENFERRSGRAANLNAELDSEAQAWVAEREGPDALPEDEDDPFFAADDEGSHNGDDDDDDDIDGLLGGRKDPHAKVETNRANPVELVRAIRHELEETHSYLEGLRTDAGLVQQSLQWLGGDKDKGKGKEGANGGT